MVTWPQTQRTDWCGDWSSDRSSPEAPVATQESSEPIQRRRSLPAGTLSSAAVASRFGVTKRTIQRWVRDRRIVPHIRTPGGHMRFLTTDVDNFELQLVEERARKLDIKRAATENYLAARRHRLLSPE
jgi:excisionase family DNA binding protein